MATLAQDQLYPMSTEDGTAIPLDIIKPQDVAVVSLPQNAATSMTFTAGQLYCQLSSSIDCVVDLTDTASYPFSTSTRGMFLRAGKLSTIQLPYAPIAAKIIPINAGEAGKLYVHGIQKWAGLGLSRQLRQR